jgi:hypothetical protein
LSGVDGVLSELRRKRFGSLEGFHGQCLPRIRRYQIISHKCEVWRKAAAFVMRAS